ncbi:uncharacterized protein LOC128653928 isoform X3 [Bombina bombina]|uniref:uncharacterized protein LOC128653928 isoform X3 n=1 Tax=Bombina bombina TaxID=8345 RepID=UPI00235AD36D|nr:uncharacterized protein LOC128653928 isoform X3 [Bombina bombina]
MDPVIDDLIFESFLEKRKDTRKSIWAKYWFRLQNTTLYFYTKQEANLSADSVALRDVWVKILWKAMQLPGPGRKNSSCTWFDIPDLVNTVQANSKNGLYKGVCKQYNKEAKTFESASELTDQHIAENIYDVPRRPCLLCPQQEQGFQVIDGSNFNVYDICNLQEKQY